jgi:hypothetical protein
MSIAKKLYQVTQELPEQMQSELLDFAEFLKLRNSSYRRQPLNIAQRIHQRFKNYELTELPIPDRQASRMPPRMQ